MQGEYHKIPNYIRQYMKLNRYAFYYVFYSREYSKMDQAALKTE